MHIALMTIIHFLRPLLSKMLVLKGLLHWNKIVFFEKGQKRHGQMQDTSSTYPHSLLSSGCKLKLSCSYWVWACDKIYHKVALQLFGQIGGYRRVMSG
jgi:hypothetical protein